ncbi:MAG: TetR-like C-terminal domain-containing protein [Lysinibacillus sp.]
MIKLHHVLTHNRVLPTKSKNIFLETLAQKDEKYMAFLTHFYTLSFTATAISWLQGEMDYTVEEIIQQIDRLLQEHIEGAKVSNVLLP